jgi:hypothetical protein
MQIQPEQLSVDTVTTDMAAAENPQEMTDIQETVPEVEAASTADIEDDEADFLAEMAMGDEDVEAEESTLAEESSMSDLATINELESMLTQLRSFESVMKTRPEQNTPSNDETADSSNVNITNLEAVSSFLNVTSEQPQVTAPTPGATASSRPVASSPAPAPAPSVRYKEIRNRDTDDSVNSLVDLLKDDGQPKKRGFFGGRSKKKNIPKEILPDAGPTSYRPEPVPSRPEPIPAPAPAPRQMREVRRPESDDSVDSLVDLLKDNNTKSKRFKGWGGKSSSAADEFRMSSSTPSVSTSNPVPVAPKPVQHKTTYTRVSTSQPNATADVTATPVQGSNMPKPSVSEPRVYKPTATKSFEEKAASPNARSVETTATITKPLEAKAISTKPSEAKSVEAKNVETKAVVTPKPAAKPAPEPKQENDPMDDFKRRLQLAHLIPDSEDNK